MAKTSNTPPTVVGYILEAAGRPSVEQQEAILGLHGVEIGPAEKCFRDAVTKRTTRPQSVLTSRGVLLSYLHTGDTLVVAGVECLGLSEADVRWFLDQVSEIGVKIIVDGGTVVVEPESDTTAIIERVRRHQKALHMRNYRAK